jgi:hypothetical protein
VKARYYLVALVVLVVMAKGCAPASAQVHPREDPHRYYHQERPDPVDRLERHGWHHDRRGFVVGFGIGAGAGALHFEKPDGRDHEPGAEAGFLGDLRAGVAVSNSFAFCLEAHGFGREANGSKWDTGAGLVTVTWWPDGGGFFLRLGAGEGRIEIKEPHADGLVREIDREGPAGYVALGYEWRVARSFAVAVLVEGLGIDPDPDDELEGMKDLGFGYGGMAVQFTWYP